MTPVWLVLPDPFSSRLFFDTGIVDRLRRRLEDRLELFLLDTGEQAGAWSERAGTTPVTEAEQLRSGELTVSKKVLRRTDAWLDRRIGFYPLSLRHSLRHGFNRERMRPGHQNWFLDPTLAGPLPRWAILDPAMMRWHYGRLRYVPEPLLERLHRDRPAILLANIQMHAVVPFVVGGRRLGLPLVGHIASWDHTVGKGIVTPHLRRYVVQNDVMRDDLVRYHGIDAERIVVTGWPQTDVFHRRRPRAEYEQVVRELGLDPSRPVVLVMGNTPTNAPFEDRFVERLVHWWQESGATQRFSLLFRPHPRDREWRERFGAALSTRWGRRSGAELHRPRDTRRVASARRRRRLECGHDSPRRPRQRPPDGLRAVRRGSPAGGELGAEERQRRALLRSMESDAFYRAERFDDVVAGIERALSHPDELAAERARAAREVVGEVDGRAGGARCGRPRLLHRVRVLSDVPRSFRTRAAVTAVAACCGFLVAVWLAIPWVGGDTPFVLDGSNALLTCLSNRDFVSCGFTGELNHWGLMTPIGYWPLLQYIPDVISIELGATSHPDRTRLLAGLGVAGLVGSAGSGEAGVDPSGTGGLVLGVPVRRAEQSIHRLRQTDRGRDLRDGTPHLPRRCHSSPSASAGRRTCGVRRLPDEGDRLSVRGRARHSRPCAGQAPDGPRDSRAHRLGRNRHGSGHCPRVPLQHRPVRRAS